MARQLAVKVVFLGLAEPGDGVAGTAFTQFETIEEGSIAVTTSDPQVVTFRAEGMDDPWEQFNKKGEADYIEFNIPSPKLDELAYFLGGTVTGQKWEKPAESPILKRTLKIQTAEYKGGQYEFVYPYCDVSAKITQMPSAEQTNLLQVRCTILTPVANDGTKGAPMSVELK